MRQYLKHAKTIGTTALLVMLFLVIYAGLGNRGVGISLELEVAKPNQMRVYWTTRGREFSEDRKGILPLTTGQAAYNIAFSPKSRPFHFQLNSGEDIEGLTIQSLEVQRVGRKSKLYTAKELSDRLLVLDIVGDWTIDDNGLSFNDSERRISFRFDNLNAGKKNNSLVTAAQALSGAVLALLGWLLLRRIEQNKSYWLRYLGIALTLPWWLPLIELKLPFAALIWLKSLSLSLIIVCIVLLWQRRQRLRLMQVTAPLLSMRLLLPIVMFGSITWLTIHQLPQIRGFWSQPTVNDASLSVLRPKFESFFRKNFKYRKHFIEINSEVKVTALATSPTHKVIVGRDGFMFEGRGHRRVVDDEVQMFDNISDYMGQQPLTDSELVHWAQVLQQRQQWLAQQGVPYLFVMAPTKDMIYEDKLPARLRRHGGATRRFDQLLEYLEANTDLAVVDLRPAVVKARAAHEYPELYYRSDFHWNYFGAFFAYEAIIKAANTHFPALKLQPLKLADFSIDAIPDWVHHRFMHTLGLDPNRHRYEHYIRMQPLDRSRFPAQILPDTGVQDVHWDITADGQRPKTRQLNLVKNSSGELDTLLILGDSFIEKTILYFSVHARKTLYQRAVLDFPLTAFEQNKPQLVVQEILNMYLLQTPPSNPPKIR